MNPVPLLGWDAPASEWLQHRKAGVGASDVAALLGLIPQWCTPWKLWAVKTGYLPDEPSNDAMELGNLLEPWLISQAPRLLGQDVQRTPHKLYAHPEHDWRLCSPDAFAADGGLVEAKTAKLCGWGDPEGWADNGVPLAYEFQGRWQMHVMDRPRVHFVGLIAGLGLVTRTVERDRGIESELVPQVEEWRQRHIVDGEEPAVDSHDVEALAARYNAPDGTAVELSPEAALWVVEYAAARDMESAGKAAKKEPKARLQALLGNHTTGLCDGHPTVTWNPKRGEIDWETMARDLAKQAGLSLPDPEQFRKLSSRSFNVK